MAKDPGRGWVGGKPGPSGYIDLLPLSRVFSQIFRFRSENSGFWAEYVAVAGLPRNLLSMGISGVTEGVSSVPDPEVSGLGPAMQALTAPQRRFAMAAVMYPFAKDWQIAKAAGYSDRSHEALR